MKKELIHSAKKIHKIFSSKRLTLSVAESCTGGLISHCFTNVPGASEFFVSSVVSYSEFSKKKILGILPEVISNHGVISEETAKAMARRVRIISETDYSISTTGNLGPLALEEKEVGLIYIAASGDGKTISRRLNLKGSRDENKERATLEAMRLLIELVEERMDKSADPPDVRAGSTD